MAVQMILALSIIVAIHEFGHLITAKIFGMRVEKYFIGFPPKIFSFKYKGTEYGLGSVPLGGFVKISGIIDESFDTKHVNKKPEPWEFRAKPAWQRLIVMLGGIVLNVITGIIIFVSLTYKNGDQFISKDEINKHGIIALELGKEIGLETGDKIININGEDWIKDTDLFNPNVFYEVGTEEAIFKYSPNDLNWFLNYLKTNLEEKKFLKIKYAVIQSGTRLNLYERKNTGIFDEKRCSDFIFVVKKYNLLSKEHNGDYLIDGNEIKKRFDIGLDSINIAPEFGQIESEYYLEKCSENKKLMSKLYKICYDSGKWKKWITDEYEVSKKQLIITCCHYILSDNSFIKNIKTNFPNSDFEIKQKIKLKLNLLYEQTKNYCI